MSGRLVREQRGIVEQNDSKSRKNGMGEEKLWRDVRREGRSAAALLLEAIICSDAL